MDRLLAFLAAVMFTVALATMAIGCKSADEGPKPFVMPARPVLNVPPASPTDGPPLPAQPLIPEHSANRVEPVFPKTFGPQIVPPTFGNSQPR